MVCPDATALARFLSGALDREGTVALLDHARECPGCRDALAEGSRAMARRGGASAYLDVDEGGDETASAAAPSFPRFPRLFGGGGGGRRSGWRRTVLLGGAILVLLGIQQARDRDGGPLRALEADEVLAAAALAEGRPLVTSPRGDLDSRPMAIAALLPPGERRITARILDDGRLVHETTFRASDRPDAFERATVRSATGELPALEALLPFPSSSDLPLEPGRFYFLVLELPNGNRSAPVDFTLRGPPAD